MDSMRWTITEFITARVAEDEEEIQNARIGDGPEWWMPEHWTRERSLAECEVFRQMVELHGGSHECSTYDHTGDVDNCTWCLHAEDCSTMRLLASIWADHPDYREEWR